MLKKRIIPKLLIDSMEIGSAERPVLVRTRNYDEKFLIGDPISQAKIYQAQLADELALINITSRPIVKSPHILRSVEKLATEVFMPISVGGGIESIEDVSLLLESGADKVIINSAAVRDPSFITRTAHMFGAQCVVVAIDFRVDVDTGDAFVMTNRASVRTKWALCDWANEAVRLGAGELMINDADYDGSSEGLRSEYFKSVSSSVVVPVIGSCGVGLGSHFTDGFMQGGLEGVGAGTFFTLRDQNPMQARAHVLNAGIPIRYNTK